jgi:DNA-directed RNA polymerase subunit RPC12/RpoP
MQISYKAACPQCGSADYRRSKRRGILERFALSLIRLLPYRCHECNARF